MIKLSLASGRRHIVPYVSAEQCPRLGRKAIEGLLDFAARQIRAGRVGLSGSRLVALLRRYFSRSLTTGHGIPLSLARNYFIDVLEYRVYPARRAVPSSGMGSYARINWQGTQEMMVGSVSRRGRSGNKD